MKRHPRDIKISKAQAEIEYEIQKLIHKHKLTDGEFVQMLAGMLAGRAKLMIRFERHGNYDKPGGLE